jgi:hypothetical protein
MQILEESYWGGNSLSPFLWNMSSGDLHKSQESDGKNPIQEQSSSKRESQPKILYQ